MNTKSQCAKLATYLRKRAYSAAEIIVLIGTTCPHKRVSDLRDEYEIEKIEHYTRNGKILKYRIAAGS